MNTIRMIRADDGKTGDIHPDEVEHMMAHGWVVDEAEIAARAEQERLEDEERERAERERAAAEAAERERLAAEAAERDRLAAEQRERDEAAAAEQRRQAEEAERARLASVIKPDQPAAVEIPADWEQMQWKRQVALAEQLTGRKDITTAAEAREIIGAEVQKRAGV